MRRLLALVFVLLAVPASAQVSVIGIPPGSLAPPVIVFPASAVNGGGLMTIPLLCADGTAAAPTCGAYASEPGLGFYRNSSLDVRLAGSGGDLFRFSGGNGFINSSAQYLAWGSSGVSTPDLQLTRGGAGRLNVTNAAGAIGSSIKVDALPTVASGFGGSPAITAGSTPFAGSVNVGTGGVATSGVINFNGTAFPSAPFCVANDSTTTLAQRASASTSQLTITSAAWTASDVVTWVCISSK